MKKLIGLAIVLVALILGGYYVMGKATEKTLKHDLAAINKSNGIRVKILSYERGWFSSKASLNWKLHIPEHMVKVDDQSQLAPAQDYEIDMPIVIHHGPIIFAGNSVKFGFGYASSLIHLPKQYEAPFSANFTPESTQPKLALSLFVTYLNNSQISMVVPSFKLISKQGGVFEWQGMSSYVKLNSNAKNIKGKIKVDGFVFDKADIHVVMSSITSNYDLHKKDMGLYLGDANFSFPSLIVKNKDTTLFELTKLDITNSSDIEDGLFSAKFKSSIEKTLVNGKVYGPGNIEISLRNLDAPTLVQINDHLQKARQGVDLEKQQAWLAILPEIPKLLTKGPEFEISDFRLKLPEGTIEGNALISIPVLDKANLFELMQKLQGKGKLRIPAEVVKLILTNSNIRKLTQEHQAIAAPTTQAAPTNPAPVDIPKEAAALTEKQISSMLQSGLLVQDSNNYVIEFAFVQGKFSINGKQFSESMLKF